MAIARSACLAFAFAATLVSAEEANLDIALALEWDLPVAKIFSNYDEDNDGLLSLEEFFAMVPKHDADLAGRQAKTTTKSTTTAAKTKTTATKTKAKTTTTAPDLVQTTALPSPRKPSLLVRVSTAAVAIAALAAFAAGAYKYRLCRRRPTSMAGEDCTEQQSQSGAVV